MKPIADLAEQWRKDAELLDHYGDDKLAKACRSHADQVDEALRAVSEEALDLSAAARESGYSVDRLRHLIAGGELPNVGRRGAPRVRRGDLPRKRQPTSIGFDAKARARELLGSDA
jgi:hypothetical protein